MKYVRKCPCFRRRATKRIGKLDFCENCYKEVHKHKSKYVWAEKYVTTLIAEPDRYSNLYPPKIERFRVYTDRLIKVY